MRVEKRQIGDKKVMPFTIPSGIVMTEVACAERLLKNIPEVGIWTTKSIGPEKRAGNREPILAQYHPGCFVNAVGLTNPGAEEFAEKLENADIPKDKFLLASIFGKNIDEFVFVARNLKNYVDGFELNFSCPHAKEVGMALGQDPKIVYEITKAVVDVTKKIVIPKLTPNTNKITGGIGRIASAAMRAGAYGLALINTAGPEKYCVDGYPVLTNKVGGKSGRDVRDIGVQRVREVREAVGENILIIGMGGIATARDIAAYASAGANIFGIGSALAGMTEREIKKYFSSLVGDLDGGTSNAKSLLKEVDMGYRKVRITEKIDIGCDFKLFRTDGQIKAEPGQFVFAWLPGIGEKPFSVMDDNPLTLGILERGEFTKKINSLEKEDYFYIRGPYGKTVSVPDSSNVTLVGGGCGIVGLYLLAKKLSKKASVVSLLAAKDKEHLSYLKEFKKCSVVKIATEDGSLGRKGFVTDLLRSFDLTESYFFNCGPKEMVEAVLPLELKNSEPKRIYSSIDYMTRCGVGICGSCADEKGRRTCIEGPFMNLKD